MTPAPDFSALATAHGFSEGAVSAAWHALQTGRGSMAQFDHPELGGAGQWMPGMLMIGDMFNHALKSRVNRLFHELGSHLEPSSRTPPEPPATLVYPIPPASPDRWYPAYLGSPSATGSQNAARFAYFQDARRLAVELAGKLTLYDTGPHAITGFAQSQSDSAGSLTFTSEDGPVPLSSLPIVDTAPGPATGEPRPAS